MSPHTARLECYAAIKDCVRLQVMTYLEEHRGDLADPRVQDVLTETLEAMECIFTILDDYDIQPKSVVQDQHRETAHTV